MSVRISKVALREYYNDVLNKARVIAYINEASKLKSNIKKPQMLKDYTPVMRYQSTLSGSRKIAGTCRGVDDIRIADWILVDASEAKTTVRHEIAHALKNYKYGMNGRPHGKEFIEALKVVSPNNWRKDRHYRETPEIVKARIVSFNNNKISLT